MDIRKIKKLIELLEESDIAEIEIREKDQAVRISRVGGTTAAAPPTISAATAAQAGAAEHATALGKADSNIFSVKSPIVGTFYESPAPGKPPFIALEQKVKAGDTLCIIEAMKTMNQIEAPIDGVIKKIHARNGDPVEYDQELVDIEKS